jgi:hypothetical protein
MEEEEKQLCKKQSAILECKIIILLLPLLLNLALNLPHKPHTKHTNLLPPLCLLHLLLLVLLPSHYYLCLHLHVLMMIMLVAPLVVQVTLSLPLLQ